MAHPTEMDKKMLTSFYLHDKKAQMLDRLHTGSAMTLAPSLCGSLDSTLLSSVVWFCPYFGGRTVVTRAILYSIS